MNHKVTITILLIAATQCGLISCAVSQKVADEEFAPYVNEFLDAKYWRKLIKKYKLKEKEAGVYEFSIKETGYLIKGEESPDWSDFLWISLRKPNGTVIMRDGDGKKRAEHHYKDEKMIGNRVTWDENGEKESEAIYDGERFVKRTIWFRNGERVETDSTGLDITYYPNGNKKSEGKYNENWQQTGMWKFWNEDGTLKEEKEFNPE